MSKPVRLSEEVYSRLGNLAEGFETPSDAMLRILNSYEYSESYKLLKNAISAKIEILKDEPLVDKQEAGILLHYDQAAVKRAIEQIIEENSDYKFTYQQNINSIVVTVERN